MFNPLANIVYIYKPLAPYIVYPTSCSCVHTEPLKLDVAQSPEWPPVHKCIYGVIGINETSLYHV